MIKCRISLDCRNPSVRRWDDPYSRFHAKITQTSTVGHQESLAKRYKIAAVRELLGVMKPGTDENVINHLQKRYNYAGVWELLTPSLYFIDIFIVLLFGCWRQTFVFSWRVFPGFRHSKLQVWKSSWPKFQPSLLAQILSLCARVSRSLGSERW